jgi:hypothetical protein
MDRRTQLATAAVAVLAALACAAGVWLAFSWDAAVFTDWLD